MTEEERKEAIELHRLEHESAIIKRREARAASAMRRKAWALSVAIERMTEKARKAD